nr:MULTISPECIES: SIMPL domain-containing protein [Sphingomonas]
MRTACLILALSFVSASAPAAAQSASAVALGGTRLDIAATGEVSRVPDVAIITTGVVTRAVNASDALAQNAARVERVRAAVRRAGVAERDVQTSSVNLNPDYVYAEGQPPRLTGYQASNQLSVRFRDIRTSGAIIDALVAQGANQISGPNLTIDKPEAALDEARTKALAVGRARAALYARSLGMQVIRLVSVSEGGAAPVGPVPMAMMRTARAADTEIVPGEQQLSVTLQMSFELR